MEKSKALFLAGLMVLVIGMVVFWLNQWGSQNNKTPISYFDQKEPGLKPEPFAPEIFSSTAFRLHGFPTFSPDGKNVYWPVIPPKILVMRYSDNKWTGPEVASFSEKNIQAPFFSTDGKKIYFQLSHPEGHGSLDIYYIEKNDSIWSEKKNLGSPPNSEQIESQPTFTKSGTVYFTGFFKNGLLNRGIYRSRYRNNRYENPELLPELINTQFLDYSPFISPDESFLLFSSTRPSQNEDEIRIYISFRDRNDSWTVPRNVNRVMDFDHPSRFPCLTPDLRFIIFQSGNTFYWVSSKVIEKCR